jgi:hypothetical protein
MGRELAAGTVAGVAYDGDDATSIASALIRASDTLSDLAALAKQRAADWQRTMTLDAFLDWLKAEIARREFDAGRSLRRKFGGGTGRVARDWFAGRPLRS